MVNMTRYKRSINSCRDSIFVSSSSFTDFLLVVFRRSIRRPENRSAEESPSVDVQRLAGDLVGFPGGQEHDRVADPLRGLGLAHGDHQPTLFLKTSSGAIPIKGGKDLESMAAIVAHRGVQMSPGQTVGRRI
jgi:hypothetical protein